MTRSESLKGAVGGLLAMAAALGIGRFVYTPILPFMLDALRWSKADAGLVASANFLGYLAGALIAGHSIISSAPRRWLLIALAASAATTAGMGLVPDTAAILATRCIGGAASAIVIVCASTLVLDRLSAAGRGNLASIHFAGVGAGIFVSSAVVAALAAYGAGWPSLWIASGSVAALMALAAAVLVRPAADEPSRRSATEAGEGKPTPIMMTAAYGLFGFGYVITATFLVTIVRQSPEVRSLEPWIWMLFGLAAVPSVPLWQWLGQRIGLMRAYAVACVVEAIGVVASIDWITVSGICVSAVLLGGTFMGLTALGLMSGRALAGDRPQQVIGLMTASFGAGQMIGPSPGFWRRAPAACACRPDWRRRRSSSVPGLPCCPPSRQRQSRATALRTNHLERIPMRCDQRRDLLGLLPLPGPVGWVERLRDPTRWSAIVVGSREELDPTYECCAST